MGWSAAGVVLGVLVAVAAGAIPGVGLISPLIVLRGLVGIAPGILGALRGSRTLGVAALAVSAVGLAPLLALLALIMVFSSANGA